MIRTFKMQLTIALLSLTLAGTTAFVTKSLCPDVTTKPDFDATQYVGRWYQQSELGNHRPGIEKCVHTEYQAYPNGTLSVYNGAIGEDLEVQEICGLAFCPDEANPAQCQVLFPFNPIPGTYWVLDTDYENWAAVYSCTDVLGLVKAEFAWVLAREPVLSPELLATAFEAYTSRGIDITEFETTVHDDGCTYEKPDPTCADEL
ncbi:apolipoprotein D-like [Tigriopus californicus]|uniref:apolipoprotein D-like n=1 Tax=Tigriopus californicus TaxID=6832 RepID=UPI0027DA32ED|nr:apolipoprotein D-like [Tigriopus californicus]